MTKFKIGDVVTVTGNRKHMIVDFENNLGDMYAICIVVSPDDERGECTYKNVENLTLSSFDFYNQEIKVGDFVKLISGSIDVLLCIAVQDETIDVLIVDSFNHLCKGLILKNLDKTKYML